MTTPLIAPTVGRIVWYRLHKHLDADMARFNTAGERDPLAAMIVGVDTPTHVNLIVYDAVGNPFARKGVPLIQGPDATASEEGGYCEWMPYQKGQAAKTEALDRVTQAPAPVPAPLVFPSLEHAIQAKANKAPRVTPADIEAEIVSEHYFTAADGAFGAIYSTVGSRDSSAALGDRPVSLSLLTFAVLVLRNGFTVTGESACASPENFDAEIGRRIARENAVNKIWPLLGFRLRDKLAAQT